MLRVHLFLILNLIDAKKYLNSILLQMDFKGEKTQQNSMVKSSWKQFASFEAIIKKDMTH